MNLYCSCLLLVEYISINSFSICYRDLFFGSNKIAVWNGFLILDNFICAYRYVFKDSYAVFIGSCRNVYLTSAV